MRRFLVPALVALLLAAPAHPEPRMLPEFTSLTDFAASALMKLPAKAAWKKAVPGARQVEIPSSLDGEKQRALFLAPEGDEPRPLLVVLHSWSEDYLQHHSIPYAVWAERNGWVFIHPDYRGEFKRPEATGSELARQDVLDAVEYAKTNARVDPRRIYLAGYSGGGMMALTLAGLHPDLWAGVVAWGAIFDLVQWHRECEGKYRRYAREIRLSCGGAPLPGTPAEADCRRRSPSSVLEGARRGPVRVLIAAGTEDPFVRPTHSIAAFNLLARPEDRLSAGHGEHLVRERRLPPELERRIEEPHHQAAGRPLLFERTSGQATLRLYEGRHDVVYNAGLVWLAGQIR